MKMTVNKTYIGKASPSIRIINSNCDSSTNHQAKGIQKQTGLSLGPYCQNTRKPHHFSFFPATLSGLDTFHLHLLLLFHLPSITQKCDLGQRECTWSQRTTFV